MRRVKRITAATLAILLIPIGQNWALSQEGAGASKSGAAKGNPHDPTDTSRVEAPGFTAYQLELSHADYVRSGLEHFEEVKFEKPVSTKVQRDIGQSPMTAADLTEMVSDFSMRHEDGKLYLTGYIPTAATPDETPSVNYSVKPVRHTGTDRHFIGFRIFAMGAKPKLRKHKDDCRRDDLSAAGYEAWITRQVKAGKCVEVKAEMPINLPPDGKDIQFGVAIVDDDVDYVRRRDNARAGGEEFIYDIGRVTAYVYDSITLRDRKDTFTENLERVATGHCRTGEEIEEMEQALDNLLVYGEELFNSPEFQAVMTPDDFHDRRSHARMSRAEWELSQLEARASFRQTDIDHIVSVLSDERWDRGTRRSLALDIINSLMLQARKTKKSSDKLDNYEKLAELTTRLHDSIDYGDSGSLARKARDVRELAQDARAEDYQDQLKNDLDESTIRAYAEWAQNLEDEDEAEDRTDEALDEIKKAIAKTIPKRSRRSARERRKYGDDYETDTFAEDTAEARRLAAVAASVFEDHKKQHSFFDSVFKPILDKFIQNRQREIRSIRGQEDRIAAAEELYEDIETIADEFESELSGSESEKMEARLEGIEEYIADGHESIEKAHQHQDNRLRRKEAKERREWEVRARQAKEREQMMVAQSAASYGTGEFGYFMQEQEQIAMEQCGMGGGFRFYGDFSFFESPQERMMKRRTQMRERQQKQMRCSRAMAQLQKYTQFWQVAHAADRGYVYGDSYDRLTLGPSGSDHSWDGHVLGDDTFPGDYPEIDFYRYNPGFDEGQAI